MRKYVIGVLIGFCLSFAVSAYAEDVTTTLKNIIGSVVEGSFPVTVNGTKIEDPAAVIKIGMDDKGYLPIRAIGDALGVEIVFDPDLGVFINGTPKSVTDTTYTADNRKAISDQVKILHDKNEELLTTLTQNSIEQDAQHAIYKYYEIPTDQGPDNGIVYKEKDDAYYAAKKKWDDLQLEEEKIKQQIKDVGNEINEIQGQLTQ